VKSKSKFSSVFFNCLWLVCCRFESDFITKCHVDYYPPMRMGRWLVECLCCSHRVCKIKPLGLLVVQVQRTCCFESFGLIMVFHANLLLAQASLWKRCLDLQTQTQLCPIQSQKLIKWHIRILTKKLLLKWLHKRENL
jgi:hypothetical protein